MTTLYGNVVVNETENLTRAQDALVRRRAKRRPRAVATAMPHGGGDEVLHGQTGHLDQMAHGRLTGMGPPVARWSAVLTTTKACTPGSFTGSDLAKHSERPSRENARTRRPLPDIPSTPIRGLLCSGGAVFPDVWFGGSEPGLRECTPA